MMLDLPYKMLSLCQEASPTGKEQRAFARIYNEKRSESDGAIITALARALCDGLDHGKWPEE